MLDYGTKGLSTPEGRRHAIQHLPIEMRKCWWLKKRGWVAKEAVLLGELYSLAKGFEGGLGRLIFS